MKSKHKICDLHSCFMCWYSTSEWMEKIAAKKQTLAFKKGEVIFKEGSPATGIYFLLEGIVKVHKHWGENKDLILHFSKPGELFGYRGLGDDTIYPVTATVLEHCTACFVPMDFFNETLRINHELTLQFLRFHLNELKYAELRMRNLALMDVKGRIADAILMLEKRFGKRDDGFIGLQLKRQDLAAYAGTTYETFFRMVNELIKEGAIAVKGKQFSILNHQKLAQYGRVDNPLL